MFSLSYSWLRWTRPSPSTPPTPLPKGINRDFIATPNGRLEILSAHPDPNPNSSAIAKTPILFIHGGMTGAWVWTEYMSYLAQHGIPCYALSLRGHGESWAPSYIRMVFFTPKGVLAGDLLEGIRWVQGREGKEVVLVGHSSGGGLCQYVLSEGRAEVKGLALLGAVPGFSSFAVYSDWIRMDPLFLVRMVLQGWHPNSPLSHPRLTKQAFFSNEIPEPYLIAFQRRMCRYESLLWPYGMLYPFANASRIMQSVTGGARGGERVLVLSGSGDRLMTMPTMRRLAEFLRAPQKTEKSEEDVDVEGLDTTAYGVRSAFVVGAGHHLQNDVQWEDGAKKLLEFYKRL